MKRINDILLGLCSMMLALLLTTACSSSDHDEDIDESAVLNIYVYAPENPMPTRLDQVPAEDPEKTIHQLQIWVFRHDTGGKVGYIARSADVPAEAADLPTGEEPKAYQIDLKELKDFVEATPNVDVYVAVNASAVGLTLDGNTTSEELDAAMIQLSGEPAVDYFGVTTPVTSVPANGLPMSGVLRDFPLGGSAPIFSVGNVTLKRAVSRVRFVAGVKTGYTLKIKRIEMNAGMLPTQEYLFLGTTGTWHLPAEVSYNSGATLLTPNITFKDPPNEGNLATDERPTYDHPTAYLYKEQVKYEEEVIGEGITENHIAELDRCYLRESDQKIRGTIYYQFGNDETEKSATFEMEEAGEFSRNHSWVVYAYYAGGDNLEVEAVFVKDWQNLGSIEHQIYNW